VHAVERAQEGGLATAGRTHQRRHLALGDVDADLLDGVGRAVVDVEAGHFHLDRAVDGADIRRIGLPCAK
jgi:hypothetical protein